MKDTYYDDLMAQLREMYIVVRPDVRRAERIVEELTMNATSYTLENRAECAHCGGTARCADCNGDGEDGNVGNEGACETCEGTGVCSECMDGVEQWLVRGERASCLTHREAWQFMCTGIVPDWFEKFHDEKAQAA